MAKKEIKKIKNEPVEFVLDSFSGPLDLLLHLARTKEIEISEVKLNQLIEQYLTYIKQIEKLGINIAAEYLEMAAELIRLKSLTLININEEDEDLIEQFEELEISRELLIQRLLEYKTYKTVAPKFDKLIKKRQKFLSPPMNDFKEYRIVNFENSLNIEDFIEAVKRFLQKQDALKKEEKVLNIKAVSIEEFLEELEFLQSTIKLLEHFKTLTIDNRISFFLAFLEAIKLQYVTYIIDDEQEEIYIIPKETDE